MKPVITMANRPRIFVQIASYRDPECQHTVKDLFDKATYPERITVGICWQFVKEEDAICFRVPYPYPKQVRVHEVDARKGRGVCWARSLTQKLWKGEEFTLQLDSHMRFEQGWDEILFRMWNQLANPKAVLTCYPAGYTPPDTIDRGWYFGMAVKEFDSDGILKMHGKPAYKPENQGPTLPMHGAFASANMLFGPSSIIKDVPYDPNLYFFGEEITLAVRLWTHGYDLYHPNGLTVYHDWDRGKRPTHFSDHPKDWQDLNTRSLARVRHLLGTEVTDDEEVLIDIDKFGLGTARTLKQYERYSGVDFARKTFSEHAAAGVFDKAARSSPANEKPTIFVRIASYRDSECQWTVKDLFEKATYPDRITVGICWQFDEKEDEHCFEVTTRPDQVRVYPIDWRESEGVCWARAQTEMLMENETYTLQIDSHMRFAPGWDEALIEELALCPSPKSVLSSAPSKYTPPNNLEPNPKMLVRTFRPFNSAGNMRGRSEFIDVAPEAPLLGALVAGGFIFSRSELVHDIPYDPYLYFDQEEIIYSLRLYTHGWDVYIPRKQYLYHFYNMGEVSGRPLHWNDLRSAADQEKLNFLTARGVARYNHLIGHKISHDSRTLVDINKYGMGTVRSIADFEAFTGVHFKNKTVEPRAEQGGFIPNLERYRKQPIPLAPEALAAPFEAGDMMPYFVAQDTNGHMRPLEGSAGRPVLLYFLPFAEPKGNAPFFKALDAAMKDAAKPDCHVFFVFDATVEELVAYKEKYKIPHVLWADPARRITQSLAIPTVPCAFLLGPNLQIKKKYDGISPTLLAERSVTGLLALIKQQASSGKKTATIGEAAPVLILPDVFPPALCKELVEAFKKGDTVKGEVGDKGYVATIKQREDFIVPEELRRKIDIKLSRNLFPEIEKIFGFKITGRENYKIGRYSGKEQGFFASHRDNFHEAMGYRRVALTLHLSDDYEGGGLRFPEYDQRIYRPGQGSAIAFSCGMVHEACKVTKGERFVLIGFFHGEEEEAYRQHYARTHSQPLLANEFQPLIQQVEGIPKSRDFYRTWQAQHKTPGKAELHSPIITTPTAPVLPAAVFSIGPERHSPVKVFEARGGVVFDNFLPQKLYDSLQHFCHTTDYEHINTKGKVARAWHIHDGFPLRSVLNSFYYPDKSTMPSPKPNYVYPTDTAPVDRFIEYMLEFQPHVERYTGKPKQDWDHFSVTSWLYPPGTGLSMHDDGSGVYTGAYAFFLNKIWRPHWGGMLIILDDIANDAIHSFRRTVDQGDYHRKKWLHINNTDELILEHGLARCIFPKGNRMVFIANDAYHMVTRVNEAAGDNSRLSLAGFFDRTKMTK